LAKQNLAVSFASGAATFYPVPPVPVLPHS